VYSLNGTISLNPMVTELDRVLVERYNFTEPDGQGFADFLPPILDFTPENRSSAAQCFKHPWLRSCLDPLNFYKILFLGIAYKNWFLNKNCVRVFRDQFLKTINQFLLSSF
jgi:serine/threonine protein kinase